MFGEGGSAALSMMPGEPGLTHLGVVDAGGAGPSAIRHQTDWAAILQPDVGLIVERRAALPGDALSAAMDAIPAAGLRADGPVTVLQSAVAGLPPVVGEDIVALADRFAGLTASPQLRLRLDIITTDSCRKWHCDFTDLRLLVTYLGPGTEYRSGRSVRRVPTGAVALFKGHDFGAGQTLVRHRSPPIVGTGLRRLVLVIDTPFRHPPAAIAPPTPGPA